MKNRLEIIVAGILRKNNSLLCIKQDKGTYKDFIWLPAGHLEKGESPEEAVIREVKEETGLNVKVKKLVMKVQFKPFLFYFYLCEIVGGKIETRGEIKKIFWLTFDKILRSKKVHPLLYLIACLSIKHSEFYDGIE